MLTCDTILVQTTVAVGMGEKVLGPVGRATHVVGHDDSEDE
jgi:hypothetical protein